MEKLICKYKDYEVYNFNNEYILLDTNNNVKGLKLLHKIESKNYLDEVINLPGCDCSFQSIDGKFIYGFKLK